MPLLRSSVSQLLSSLLCLGALAQSFAFTTPAPQLLSSLVAQPFSASAPQFWRPRPSNLVLWMADKKKIPDAITQTDNSAKRQQNAQLRANKARLEEPEALRKMREEREAREAAEQAAKEAEEEARETKASEEAVKRAKTGNFISGQEVREQRLIDEYKKRQQDQAPQSAGGGGDIRLKVKAMQGSQKRSRPDPEGLRTQSMEVNQTVAEAKPIVINHMNAKHPGALGAMALQLNPEIAAKASKANAFMNGAFQIPSGQLTDVTEDHLTIEAEIQETGFFGNAKTRKESIEVPFPSRISSSDDLKFTLMSMLREVGLSEETASILAMEGLGSKGWSIPDNLWLNEIPCNPDIRDWFYRDACDAVQVALDDQKLLEETGGRLKIELAPPEVNPEMDTFRVGTMLELVREIAIRVAVVQGKRVRICIQGSMGEGMFAGLPLMLSGMRRVLEGMDWQSSPGEVYEGILVQDILNRRTMEVAIKGNPKGKIDFGEVGPQFVTPEDEVFIVIAPQPMVGASIYQPLSSMIEAGNGRPFIFINPRLKDRPSSGDVMSVRGRSVRMAFAESFKEIYHFRLLFKGSEFMFPIRGILRMNCANSPFWTVFKREESVTEEGMDVEHYEPVATFESEPGAEEITKFMK